VILSFPAGRYERCDANGCDAYELTSATGGIFTTVTPGVHRGAFLKALNDGSEYVETVSLGTAIWTAFGACVPVR
jgi:hypothetical protein